MSIVTTDMAMSLDGYAAGPRQRREAPFGDGPSGEITRWMFDAAEANSAELEAVTGAAAYIMGRNMFGPDRGEYDLDWRGWWGSEPPYHAPVFVLGHHEREPLTLSDTTFTFVTGGIHEALDLAREAAGGGRIDIAGGARTVNQYLAAGLIDEIRVHVTPVIMGEGTRLFEGVRGVRLEQVTARGSDLVSHITYRVLRD
ncbi:dihydrofolate reductase [Nocardiopsis alba]|uniref:Dihydrofolate reductase n=1 Tax=Nocardiopsis alba TaxID=53437 RepID=A0A7K2IMH4_9ACTN|nr:dihydrofolate reductase family protein [Nocardiopsis alba]MYR31037.1 dihydrofolate reductase [Nocardiopsis alba]